MELPRGKEPWLRVGPSWLRTSRPAITRATLGMLDSLGHTFLCRTTGTMIPNSQVK